MRALLATGIIAVTGPPWREFTARRPQTPYGRPRLPVRLSQQQSRECDRARERRVPTLSVVVSRPPRRIDMSRTAAGLEMGRRSICVVVAGIFTLLVVSAGAQDMMRHVDVTSPDMMSAEMTRAEVEAAIAAAS